LVFRIPIRSDPILDESYVLICDWHGRVIWLNRDQLDLNVNDFAWRYIIDEQQEHCKTALSRVVTLGEEQVFDCDDVKGDHKFNSDSQHKTCLISPSFYVSSCQHLA